MFIMVKLGTWSLESAHAKPGGDEDFSCMTLQLWISMWLNSGKC